MSFSPKELDGILEVMQGAARRSGTLLMEGLGRPTTIEYKGAVDLVSEYDRRSEENIRNDLAAHFPEIPMLGEESVDEYRSRPGPQWIVDPLDGTTNYLHGHPIFAVSIGLEENGRSVAGVILIPALGLTLCARTGGGAHCNGSPIRVSPQTELDKSLITTGFPYDRRTSDDDNVAELRAVMKKCQGVRRCGAAAVDMAFVARGVYEGFFEPKLHAWDLAAGVVLVEEAGGVVTDFKGEAIDIFDGYVVASNGLIHDQLLPLLAPVRPEST